MGSKAGKNGFRARREKELKLAKDKAEWLRPLLEKEDGWDWATGLRKAESKADHTAERRAVTRITKKAIKLMCPECDCSVRRDTGTAHHWIIIEVGLKPGYVARKGHPQTEAEAKRMVKDILLALGIRYAGYVPDSLPGKDAHEPCLSIEVNLPS